MTWNGGDIKIENNRQGYLKVNGKTVVPTNIDHSQRPGCKDEEDAQLLHLLSPMLDTSVREINQETEALRAVGMLSPFTEGEPIGLLPRGVRSRRATEAQVVKAHNKRKEDQRSDMLKLRANNDATIAYLLRRII